MTAPVDDPEALAAKRVYDMILLRLRDEQGIHAETALCAAGAVTGRAIGQAAAEDRLGAVATTVAYLRDRCEALGVAIPDSDALPLDSGVSHRTPEALAAELQPEVAEILASLNVSPDRAVFVVARTIPALLSGCRGVIDSSAGYGIAVQALHRCVRTYSS